MMNLNDILKNSGDSVLQSYSYSKGALIINFELPEVELNCGLRIQTDAVVFNSFYLSKTEELYRTMRIEIEDLVNVLDIYNNVFIPKSEFKLLMQETKLNYNLAYGKKSDSARYLISFVGYERLVSCLVSDLDCIEIL